MAQTVPGVNVMDQGKGTLGAGEKDSAYQTSEEGKKRFQKAKSITAKKVMITGKVDESAAKTIVPFSKFFTAGYVGEEMDAVGEVLGIKAPRSKGGLLTRDFMTTNDRIYIDIGMDDDVQAGDRFIVFSQHEEVRHPLKKFFITFDREVDLLDGNYEGQYYSDWFSFRHDIEGNQIRIKGVIRILETSTITSKALVE
ncbi:MAG: hypothetical protein GWM98_04325, partial [Nitrospinaceae bacterium]|nr:hypothetical protein [Nitrospinaceae bacterium]NIR53869.1 hypothetical protein [Nitrospinaceae bacterium]NIT81090.1 hypothetical protein [Nitrospinaceae bacterium]NIY14146.1 hypothetical protein [Nitrospinaceae bacterium]